jgi:hypothetical protein
VESRTCPYCAETIQAGAIICKYCKSRLDQPEDRAVPPPPGPEDSPALRMVLPVGRSGWAIAAGYLGLFSLMVIPAPIALLVSILALRDLKRNPKIHGMGRAVFGLAMGILGTAALLLIAIAAIFG